MKRPFNWRRCKFSNPYTGYRFCEIHEGKYCAGHASQSCAEYEPGQPQGFKHHNELKEKARQQLLDLGFALDEIYSEYKVVIPVTLRVDIVGIKPDLKIAIECGDVPPINKFWLLTKVFNEVLWVSR
jgi:hypothetical protein